MMIHPFVLVFSACCLVIGTATATAAAGAGAGAAHPLPSSEAIPISYSVSGDPNSVQGTGLSICATFDFWPAAKTDYGNSSWIDAGIFDSNLQHPTLINAATALLGKKGQATHNSVLRIGGTLGDHIIYDMSTDNSSGPSLVDDLPCVPIYINASNPTHFSGGCLNLSRWIDIHSFCYDVSCQIVFGLNALYGNNEHHTTQAYAWDSTNTEQLISMTAQLGYDRTNTMFGFELGNELSGGGGGISHINATEYAHMFETLYNIVTKYYPDEATRPYLLGPDMINGDPSYLTNFLNGLSNPNIIYAATYHNYMAAGKDSRIDTDFMNPVWLESHMSFADTMGDAVDALSWPSQLWMGETGGAYNSGRNTITNAFEGSFWYSLELGLMSNANHSAHCRQALIGGAYALIQVHEIVIGQKQSADTDTDTDTTSTSTSSSSSLHDDDLPLPHPNPDYFTALLFQSLVGGATVITISADDDQTEVGVRAFAYCQRLSSSSGGNVVLMFQNFNGTHSMSMNLSFNNITGSSFPRDEYHLTAHMANLQSNMMELNGKPLMMYNNQVPELLPNHVTRDTPIVLEPHSIVFVTLLNTQAQACQPATAVA